MVEMASFLGHGIFKRQMQLIGSSNMVKSDSILYTAVTVKRISTRTHRPGEKGSQILRLGIH